MAKGPSAAVAAAIGRDHRPPSEDKLDKLRSSLRVVRDLERELADLNEMVSERSAKILDMKMKSLPDLFAEAGVDNIGLPAEGNLPAYDVELKPYYKANIAVDWPDDKRQTAFAWLDDNGHGDLIKSMFVVSLGRDDRTRAKKVEKALEKLGVPFSVELGVPWNTLTAFVKERIEKHKESPPLETLGAIVGKIVNLKPRKES